MHARTLARDHERRRLLQNDKEDDDRRVEALSAAARRIRTQKEFGREAEARTAIYRIEAFMTAKQGSGNTRYVDIR